MPPRFAYWTILIDQKPTAFRARDRAELLPTFIQLQRANPDILMKWFARGKLWDNPEQAQWAAKNVQQRKERRGREWRPGGEHKDPRARFLKPKGQKNETRGKKPSTHPSGSAPQASRPMGSTGARPDVHRRPQKHAKRRTWPERSPRPKQR